VGTFCREGFPKPAPGPVQSHGNRRSATTKHRRRLNRAEAIPRDQHEQVLVSWTQVAKRDEDDASFANSVSRVRGVSTLDRLIMGQALMQRRTT
jgi:hypothetical protein